MSWTPSRIALAATTVCVVAAGVGAGVMLQPGKDRPAPADRGPDVSIAVVAPREPVPEPGGVMDVGDLADAYTHQGFSPPPGYIPASPEVGAYDLPATIESKRVESAGVAVSRPEPQPAPPRVVSEQREPQRRWPFGFDQPRPDYAAERRQRVARMDEDRRRESERRFEEARMADRFDERPVLPEFRDDRAREVDPDSDRGSRERQWYSGDGRPVARPDRRD
jgi:hypothetical protein